MTEPVKHHKLLSIIPTYQCTAACKYCGTFSNPRPGRPTLTKEQVLKVISEAAKSGYTGVVFTGGEPTMALPIVLAGLAAASSYRMGTRMVTNGSWAESDEAAIEMINRLVQANLREINFSTGDEHSRFVSLDNVIRGIKASHDGGIKSICLMIEVTADAQVTKSSFTSHPDYVELLKEAPSLRLRIVESPWMPTTSHRLLNYPEHLTASKNNIAARRGCSSCLSTTTVQADGRIAACCGLGMRTIPELQIGHISSTTIEHADAEARDDFLKRWIRYEGPEKILAWAAEKDPTIDWENKYAHHCQACLRLYKDPKVRSVIAEHHLEKIPDVIFGEFLMSYFNPGEAVDEEISHDFFTSA